MKKLLWIGPCLILLSACKPFSEPLIEGEMIKLSIQCTNGKTVVIDNQVTIDKVLIDINSSMREGTEKMEFDLEHQATLESNDGETVTFNLFDGGKTLVSGYYVHSNIEDYCK
ncbi:hypothetical protein [Sporosarcina sp. OR05]|uniref:hypothetical protein n=1 Tax=Sporosarcina sp. OR05 TaxID=2969819 RepID=UPI00352B17F4